MKDKNESPVIAIQSHVDHLLLTQTSGYSWGQLPASFADLSWDLLGSCGITSAAKPQPQTGEQSVPSFFFFQLPSGSFHLICKSVV